MKWEKLGLLRLFEGPLIEGHFCKVFNAFKNSEVDRQIGDRRIPNSRERTTSGPSAFLPSPLQLCSMYVPRWTHGLRCSMTDRRDFYHQASVSSSRARSNITPFSFDAHVFAGSRALEISEDELRQLKVGGREVHGDSLRSSTQNDLKLENAERPATAGVEQQLYPAFGALYQGDHLGVEFALRAHEVLLEREGLLLGSRRLRNKFPLPVGDVWEALIIDDYFCISSQPLGFEAGDSEAYSCLQQARAAYEKQKLLGPPERDLVAVELFKAAGAEIDSSACATRLGVVPAAAPLSKRIGLAAISLRVAKLPAISSSLASRLSGSWVSVLLFRRCISCLADRLFSIGAGLMEEDDGMIHAVPRSTAEDLVELAVMSPLMFSDLTAPFLDKVYATDASVEKGAVVSTKLDRSKVGALWRGCDKRGCYTRLDNPFFAALRHLG